MKILITSGGTTEPIDSVRGITNHATGSLGATIANLFLSQGHSVTLVTTQAAKKPINHPNLQTVLITNVASLMTTLEELVPKHDVMIHSMAVSDYTPVYMTDIEELNEASSVEALLNKSNTDKKISSASETQVLFLKKTPKVIRHIKSWHPNIILVGFKLLVDVSKDELIKVARKSLTDNQADYILANDLTTITPEQHLAYLVDGTTATMAITKDDIAQLILERVTND